MRDSRTRRAAAPRKAIPGGSLHIWARIIAAVILLTMTASSTTARPESPPPAAPKSLILISLDTTRADHLHCYGYSLPTSPHLDRLASQGILFETALTMAVNTGPSHASLLTGLMPGAHGVRYNGSTLSTDFATLATLLSEAGYRTGAFVSGYTMMKVQTGFERGFQVYDEEFTGQERRASETVDRALAWLKAQPAEAPYFLFVHLFDPHGKYDPPAGFAEKFRSGKYEPIPDADLIPDYQRILTSDGKTSRDPLDYISRYDGEIAYADGQIGRLLEGAGKRPIVIVTSDHGETLVERDYYFSHGARLSDEALKVPLILRVPDSPLKGRRVRGTAQLVDVLPTALTLLGRSVPSRLAGRNLLPFIQAGTIPAGVTVISEARAAPMKVGGGHLAFPPRSLLVSARTERAKLIRYPASSGTTYELFDLEKDPQERHGVLGIEAARTSPVYSALDLYLVGGQLPEPPDLDEEAKKKLRSLGYIQ